MMTKKQTHLKKLLESTSEIIDYDSEKRFKKVDKSNSNNLAQLLLNPKDSLGKKKEKLRKHLNPASVIDESNYNFVIGGVGYICLFLIISNNVVIKYNSYSSYICAKLAIVVGLISLLAYIAVPILKILDAAGSISFYKDELAWPWLFSIALVTALLSGILVIGSLF